MLVFGASGHGKVVADVVRAAGLELAGFVDDDPGRREAGLWGLPVLGWAECLALPAGPGRPAIALGIGDNRARERVLERVVAGGFEVLTVVHPERRLAPRARLGDGHGGHGARGGEPGRATWARAPSSTPVASWSTTAASGDFAHLSPNSALGGGVEIGDAIAPRARARWCCRS